MSKNVLLDEFLLRLFVSRGLPLNEADAARKTLDSRQFRLRLRSAVQAALQQSPALRAVRVQLKQ